MWNTSIALPECTDSFRDSAGFETRVQRYTKGIPADISDATRQEEVFANQAGYRADVTVKIFAGAYNGASYFIDEASGEEYDIKRAFRPERSNYVILTGQRRTYGES